MFFVFCFWRQGFEKGKELETLRNIFLPFFPYSAQMRFDHVYLEGYEPEVEKKIFFLLRIWAKAGPFQDSCDIVRCVSEKKQVSSSLLASMNTAMLEA